MAKGISQEEDPLSHLGNTVPMVQAIEALHLLCLVSQFSLNDVYIALDLRGFPPDSTTKSLTKFHCNIVDFDE